MWLTESSLYNRFCIEGPQAYSTILQCTNVIECHWLALTVCYNLHDLVRYWAGSGSEFGFWNRIYTKLLNFTRISEEVTDGFRWNFNVSITAGVCTIWLGFEPDPDQSLDPGSGHASWRHYTWRSLVHAVRETDGHGSGRPYVGFCRRTTSAYWRAI